LNSNVSHPNDIMKRSMLSMVPVAEATLHNNTDAINTVKYTTK
jgi:hypothetical protein